jgi:hypothetical protein
MAGQTPSQTLPVGLSLGMGALSVVFLAMLASDGPTPVVVASLAFVVPGLVFALGLLAAHRRFAASCARPRVEVAVPDGTRLRVSWARRVALGLVLVVMGVVGGLGGLAAFGPLFGLCCLLVVVAGLLLCVGVLPRSGGEVLEVRADGLLVGSRGGGWLLPWTAVENLSPATLSGNLVAVVAVDLDALAAVVAPTVLAQLTASQQATGAALVIQPFWYGVDLAWLLSLLIGRVRGAHGEG